jgi:hypothetical protein
MIVGEYFILQFVWTFFIKWVSGAQPFLGWRPPWPQQDIPGTPTYACREWLVNSYNSYKYIITILPAIFAVFHTVDYPKQVKCIHAHRNCILQAIEYLSKYAFEMHNVIRVWNVNGGDFAGYLTFSKLAGHQLSNVLVSGRSIYFYKGLNRSDSDTTCSSHKKVK